jgi:predicted TIM-barrel fold metal-dependent hydrolase
MLELGRSSDSAVKLSGPYRFSADGPPYLDTDEFVESAIEAFTVDRCVWGSDWPFTNPPHQVSYPHMLAALHRWVPDHRDLEKVLTVNPQRLFGRGRG